LADKQLVIKAAATCQSISDPTTRWLTPVPARGFLEQEPNDLGPDGKRERLHGWI
jgi:hypothetical protein